MTSYSEITSLPLLLQAVAPPKPLLQRHLLANPAQRMSPRPPQLQAPLLKPWRLLSPAAAQLSQSPKPSPRYAALRTAARSTHGDTSCRAVIYLHRASYPDAALPARSRTLRLIRQGWSKWSRVITVRGNPA